MIKHFVLAILLGVVIFLGYLAYHVGYFRPVRVQQIGPKSFVLLGLKHDGAYHKIVEKIQAVEAKVKEAGGECNESFGVYLDDPSQVEQERLRSFGGCIVQDAAWVREHLSILSDFQVAEWGADKLIEAYFEGSPGVGPYKVYPKVSDYIASRRFETQKSVLEVYKMLDHSKMVTYYYFPISGLQSSLLQQADPSFN